MAYIVAGLRDFCCRLFATTISQSLFSETTSSARANQNGSAVLGIEAARVSVECCAKNVSQGSVKDEVPVHAILDHSRLNIDLRWGVRLQTCGHIHAPMGQVGLINGLHVEGLLALGAPEFLSENHS
jgi:hypothetical protein